MPPAKCDGCHVTCRLFILFLGVSGFVFSLLTIAACDFLSFEGSLLGVVQGDLGIFRGRLQGVGNNECYSYRSDLGRDWDDFDGWVRAAQVCAVLAPIFGLVGCLLLLFECVFCKCCGSAVAMNLIWFFAYALQALTFLMFGTEGFCSSTGTNCSLGNGGIYSIVAVSVWLVASCVICCSPKPEPLVQRDCCCKKTEKEEDDEDKQEEPKKGCCGKKSDVEEAKEPAEDAAAAPAVDNAGPDAGEATTEVKVE